MQADSYSRLVTLLKIILPLIALALLSTVFLISRAVDTPTAIPFADNEVQQRLINRQVTGPYFTSKTADGHQLAIVAETVTSPGGQAGKKQAQDVTFHINLASGTDVDVVAQEAIINIGEDQSELSGDVVITTSRGLVVLSDYLNIYMSAIEVISPGAVEATMPFGTLDAGSMRLISPQESENRSQMFFTNGVKLLYQPPTGED
ncbi:MAG: hypothetical protein AAF665_09250 [Pseudomonadota bacterium]